MKENDSYADDRTHTESGFIGDNLSLWSASESGEQAAASGPTAGLFRLLTAGSHDTVAGTRLGRFTVRRWLGAGAFGVVYLAYDELLHREVALKLPRAQPLAHHEVRERFLREAEAAAKLHHPHVVPVFEAGQEQAVCYIATAYCHGPTLDAWLAEQTGPVPIAQAVMLVKKLAGAVQHAHEHGVLHRDIKPSNVLMETDLASPASVTPMITDFGLAKLLDASGTVSSMTVSHGMIGTPRYMAPEQATGARELIGPETDIFALGAVLYELLVGTAPFAANDQASTLHRILYDRATPPRRSRSDVPQDLEAICLKCLERESRNRYHTAQELVDELHRVELGQPTKARPIGCLESLWRWTVQQPAIAALVVLTTLGLSSLLIIMVAYSRSLKSFNTEMQTALSDTREARYALEVQGRRLQNLLHVSKMTLAHKAIEENDLQQASRLLEEARAEAPAVSDNFVWRYLWNQVAAPGELIDSGNADIYELKFSPSGEIFAACGADGILRLGHGDSFAPLISFPTEQGEVNGVAFSPDEQWVATAGDDGTVKLWKVATGEHERTIQTPNNLAFDVVFTADGSTLISCGTDPTIHLWDVATGALRGTMEGHEIGVEAITLSPDARKLASAGSDKDVRIWDIDAKRTRHVLRGHTGRVVSVVYSDDGEYLLTGSIDHTIRLWRTADGKCLQVERHVDPVASAGFFAHGEQLVAIDRQGAVHLWARNPRQPAVDPSATPEQSWKAHQGRGWQVSATPDQSALLTAGADGKVYRWTRAPKPDKTLVMPEGRTIIDLVVDPTAPRLLFIDSEEGIRSWDLASGRQSTLSPRNEQPHREPSALCMLPEQRLIAAYSDGAVEAVNFSTDPLSTDPLSADAEPVQVDAGHLQLRLPWRSPQDWQVNYLSASRDGRRLAVFSYVHDTTLIYDFPYSERGGAFKALAVGVALSDDGSRLAMADGDDIVVWDLDRRERIARFKGHTSTVVSLKFSPDGTWLASGARDRQVFLWQVYGKPVPINCNGHRDEITAFAFSPDGRLLASGDRSGELKFWFLEEAAELISIEGTQPIERLHFSPEGDRLIAQSKHQIRVFNATADVSLLNP